MKRAVLYARYSSDNQRAESIDAQVRAIEHYASVNGYELVGTYIDEAMSGKNADRPRFLDMIRDSDKGRFDTVIVHKLDRFARNRQDSATYRCILKKNGVSLCSVVENIDNSPESVILESVIEGMAEYYSLNLARETMKGLKENAYNGKHTGGFVPLGYTVMPDKTIAVNEEEARVVRGIFQDVIDGRSYVEIATRLNEQGYRTRTGRLFKGNALYGILRNQKYIGICVYNKRIPVTDGKCNSRKFKNRSEWIVNEDAFPRIVEDSIFNKVQAILDARAVGNRSPNVVYLLRGKIYCGVCGAPYVGSRKKSGKGIVNYYYACNKPKAHGKCGNGSIQKSTIEGYVLECLANYIFSDDMIPDIVDGYNDFLRRRSGNDRAKIDSLKKRLKKIEKEIFNLTSAIAQLGLSPALQEALEKSESSKRAFAAELAELEGSMGAEKVTEETLKAVFINIRAMISDGSLVLIKQLIDKFVYRVDVYPDKVNVAFNFFPDSVKFATHKIAEGCAQAQPLSFMPEICLNSEETDKCRTAEHPRGAEILRNISERSAGS